MVLDELIWAVPAELKGLTTVSTPGTEATLDNMAFARFSMAGVANVPPFASMTIWSASPEAEGKLVLRMLSARVDSVFGIWNLLEYAVFAVMSAPRKRIRATNHRARTSLRW